MPRPRRNKERNVRSRSCVGGELEASRGLGCFPLTNLQDVVSRFHICDVDPLAVDVCVVGIITSWAEALQGRPGTVSTV